MKAMINFGEYDEMETWKVYQMNILVLKRIGEGMHTQNLFHVDNYLNCIALDILDRSGIGYLRYWDILFLTIMHLACGNRAPVPIASC